MQVALSRKNTRMYPILELYTYFSMNKQYVEGVQNSKRAYLRSKGNIAIWLYHSLAELDWLVGWLFGCYGISIFVGYLMPNPFLYK